MSGIPMPATIDAAPAASRPRLEAVEKQLGGGPNMLGLVANSPAALQGYLELANALNKGNLPAATRERIALAVAEINGCNYCLSAHTYLGKNLAKLDAAEMIANRNGSSTDPKADAAVRFTVKVVRERGHVSEDDVRAVKSARHDDARNRAEFLEGREAIEAFLTRKWARELDYRLIKDGWTFRDNRIAVRFAYEWHDDSGNWFRSYGNENWGFDEHGLMRLRIASINDLPIDESERKYHWPLGRRPDGHPSLSELGL